MGTKQNTPLRAVGQRSLDSSFIFRSTNPGEVSREEKPRREKNEEASHISLSDFLDRKLHRSNVPPKTVKGKLRPFSSPLGARNDGGCTGHHSVQKKENKKDKRSFPNQVVFEQFKRSGAEKEDAVDSCKTETVSSSSGSRPLHDVGTSNSGEGTRKWRNPFEGHDKPRNSHKGLLVLGDNPASKQNEREESFINSKKKPLLVLGDALAAQRNEREESFIKSKKKPRHFYNHYGNGGGWWDSEKEGVDAEEVGFGEIWEGVGSTTFGGIEWH